MHVTVRPAALADLDTVVALRLALLRAACRNPLYERLRPDATRQARRLFRAQLEAKDEVVFLAERTPAVAGGGAARDGTPEVVGIIRCVESWGSPLLDPPRYGYVSSAYVVPRARRSGVLRALVTEVCAWCRARGLPEMRLHCAVESRVGNAAWDALGFDVVEHVRRRPIDS